jgi:F0F1-type ATP synthase epsilon subunit
MVVLPHHEPLIALLGHGEILVKKTETEQEKFTITSGVVEVSNNHATVLV